MPIIGPAKCQGIGHRKTVGSGKSAMIRKTAGACPEEPVFHGVTPICYNITKST
ncbi:hypothetical protein BN2364_1162 [Alloalcanivorax xenomutans]|nr:hypothetical protein BN2364_1162 [Alloalcanivorax xenomutans]